MEAGASSCACSHRSTVVFRVTLVSVLSLCRVRLRGTIITPAAAGFNQPGIPRGELEEPLQAAAVSVDTNLCPANPLFLITGPEGFGLSPATYLTAVY